MKFAKVMSLSVIFFGLSLLWFFREQTQVVRLGLASVVLLFFVKIAALIWQLSDRKRIESKLGIVAFIFVWPGVLLEGFQKRDSEPLSQTGERFLESWLTFISGIFLLLISSILGRGESILWNYVALFSLLMIIHLGLVEVLADGLRLVGFQPKSLFDRPFLASTLADFWGRRWNLAFVDMNKLFILSPLKGRLPNGVLVFAIFIVSGVLHELAISYPDGVSWGWPMVYFLIQGLGVLIERKIPFHRVLVILWILLPVPLMFTPAFVNYFPGSLSRWIFEVLTSLSAADFIQIGLIAGAVMHFLVLGASVQVPHRLDWKNEFQRLRPLNRKVVWTYGGYILSIIVFMGVVSFYLFSSGEVYSGPGKLWVLFIALFWWARILIDFFYMKHSDWPEGPLFRIGHVCLSTLFMTMTFLYSAMASFLYLGGR